MITNERLTGNYRYRTNWRGKLILQVEETYTYVDDAFNEGPSHNREFTGFRDARMQDMRPVLMSTINFIPEFV